jgi:hypothetical protein
MENSPVKWFSAPTPTNVIVGAAFDQPTNGSINWQAADQWSRQLAVARAEIWSSSEQNPGILSISSNSNAAG